MNGLNGTNFYKIEKILLFLRLSLIRTGNSGQHENQVAQKCLPEYEIFILWVVYVRYELYKQLLFKNKFK